MEKRHFEQAKYWMEGAKHIANIPSESSVKYAVAVSMVIHAIVKANDALTYKHLHETARRHDDARRLFEQIIKKNLIPQEQAYHKQTIQDAITNKAKAEYRGGSFSGSEFQRMFKKAERFIKLVEQHI